MTTTLEIARCPRCGNAASLTNSSFIRRGDDLICLTCEKELAEACTCETYGHCAVCR